MTELNQKHQQTALIGENAISFSHIHASLKQHGAVRILQFHHMDVYINGFDFS